MELLEESRVVTDINRIYPSHDNTDTLVFTYDNRTEKAKSQIEVIEPEPEKKEREPATYSLSPEFEKALNYWTDYYKN